MLSSGGRDWHCCNIRCLCRSHQPCSTTDCGWGKWAHTKRESFYLSSKPHPILSLNNHSCEICDHLLVHVPVWPCIFVLAAIKVIQWASRMVSDGTVGIPSAPSVLNLQKVNFGVVLWWWIILCFHYSSSLREQFSGVFLCSIFLLGAWLWPCSKIYLSVGDKFMDLSVSIDPLAIRAVYSHVPILGVILGVKIVYKLKRVDTQNYAHLSGAFCIV